jgi:mercuric ion transport protein
MLPRTRPADTLLSFATLLFSGSTLICCALPILLVSLGFGAGVAYLTNALPWIVVFGRHKVWTFSIVGIYLLLTAWMIYRPGRSCPTDPELARLCLKADRLNRIVLWVAVGIYSLGFFAAYLWFPLQQWLGVS